MFHLLVTHPGRNLASVADHPATYVAFARDSAAIEEPVHVTLRAAVTLRGLVTDQGGKPIAGARVEAGTGCTATTDADGKYTVTGIAPGTVYEARAVAEGYALGSAPLGPRQVPAAGSTVELPNVVLAKADQALSGVVVDASGSPIPDASVTAQLGAVRIMVRGQLTDHLDSVQSDKDGRFTVSGLRGKALALRATGGRDMSLYGTAWATPGDANVRIVLKSRLPRPSAGSTQPATQPAKPAEANRIGELIGRLGSTKYQERDGAQRDLVEMGWKAVPALREARQHKDPEVASRAGKALEDIFARIETRRDEARQAAEQAAEGQDAAAARRAYLALLAVPETQLRDARAAIRLFEGRQDWPALATAYEAAAEAMWRVTHLPPEAFIRPAPPPAGGPANLRGN
jgi:hypothetical protein